jgi:hypothetical protein
MKKLVKFDEKGRGINLVEVDRDEIHSGEFVVPEGITSNLACRLKLVEGEVVDAYPGMTDAEAVAAVEAEIKAEDDAEVAARKGFDVNNLAGAKGFKLKQIRDRFNAIIAGIKADAAPYELETWDIQRAEYMAFLANAEAPTPYVEGLATARGISKAELMAKIGSKITGLATVQGTQHSLEKAVEAAATLAEVNAIQLP